MPKSWPRYLLLIVVVICGTILAAVLREPEYFIYALGFAAFIGFWGLMADS